MKAGLFTALISTIILYSYWLPLAAAAPKANIEQYGRLPAVDMMAVSPNGEYLAFRRTSENQDMIIVYSTKQAATIAAADVSKIDPNSIFFHSNDVLILGVSQHKRLRNYRHALDLSTVFSYNFKSDTVEALIRLGEPLGRDKHIYLGQTGVGRILGTSPDREHLYMPAYVAEGPGDPTPSYSLLRVKTNGKGRPRVVSSGNHHVIDYFLDNAGNVVARESFNEKKNIHKIEVKRKKKWETLYEVNSELRIRSFVGLTSDFKKLVYLVYKNEDDRNAYFTMNLSDGKSQRLPYTRDDADIENIIHDENRVVYGLQYSGFMPSYKFFEAEKQRQVDKILANFPEHSVHLIDWSKNWQEVVVKVEGSNYPGNFYMFPKAGKPLSIAAAYPGIKNEDVNPIGKVKFKARDGRVIPTLITIPANHVNKIEKLPAVVLPHGGPASYDSIGFDYMTQALASQGILVIQPQFRGSTGFGYEHMRAGYGEWGKKMQDDISDTVAFFTKKGMIDGKRVCIAGASYGGYAALAGAAFSPDIYQCAVSINGVSHLAKMLSNDRSRYGKDSSVLAYFKESIGGGELKKQALREISPYFHADKIKIPVLLIHGIDDTIVAYNQSKMMHSAIKKAKGQSRLVKLKKEDHYLRDGETRLQALSEMVNFIVSHIGKQ